MFFFISSKPRSLLCLVRTEGRTLPIALGMSSLLLDPGNVLISSGLGTSCLGGSHSLARGRLLPSVASLPRINLVPESCELRGTIAARRAKGPASWVTGAEVQAVSLGAGSTFGERTLGPWNELNCVPTKFIPCYRRTCIWALSL